MNKINIIGRLTADPELRQVANNTCATFNVAANTHTREANSDQYITNFYRVSAWGKTGENCSKFLHKGDRVALVGDLTIRRYTDTKGQERYSIDVSANDVEFIQDKRDGTAPVAAKPATPVQKYVEVEDDSLPF